MTEMISNSQKIILEAYGLTEWANKEKISKVYRMLVWIKKHNPTIELMESVKKKMKI